MRVARRPGRERTRCRRGRHARPACPVRDVGDLWAGRAGQARRAGRLADRLALGIAILSTVAVSRAHDVLRGPGREAGLRAMTEGFRVAFAVAAGIAALGVLLALLLFRPRRLAEGNTPGRGQGPIPSRRRNGGRRSGRWPGAPARSRSCSCSLSDDLDRCHDALSRLAAPEKLGDRAWLTRTWRPRV
jgi:hypothetical protein